METLNEQKPSPETSSPAPERGRAWRIVAVVLTLHAALLGSVVLIQGCSKSDSPAVAADQDHSAKPAGDENTASTSNTTDSSADGKNAVTKLPSNDGLLPEENLSSTDAHAPKSGAPASPEATTAAPSSDLNGDSSLVSSVSKTPGAANDTTAATGAAPSKDSTTKASPAAAATPSPATAVKSAAPAVSTYTVKKGDTLAKIASNFNVSPKTLASANKLTTSTALKIGQKLTIPSKKSDSPKAQEPQLAKSASSETHSSTSSAAVTSSKKTHLVKAGESPTSIAKRYGVTVKSLMQANNITDPKKIRINQKLVIPIAKVSAPSRTPAVTTKDQDIKPTSVEKPTLADAKEVNHV